MTNNNKTLNVYDFIDELIADLLVLNLENEEKVNVLDVIDVLYEISDLIPEIIIDGDEITKHFHLKHRKRRNSGKIEP